MNDDEELCICKKGDFGDSDDHFEVKAPELVSDDGLGDGVVFVLNTYI